MGGSQLQFIDKVSPSCRGAQADLYGLTSVMRWFMAMVRRMFFCCFLAAFFGLPREGLSPGLTRFFQQLLVVEGSIAELQFSLRRYG